MCFPHEMDEAALRAIANPRRREILRLVWDEERSSGDIASHFNVSWPAISQNLRVLEEVGFVRSRRCRQTRLYRADRARLGPLKTVLLKMWETDLDRLVDLAETEANQKRPKK
jgi:DNA-binding transcriptional ArsR family regulator